MPTATYLVSGKADVAIAYTALDQRGRHILYDDEVESEASEALCAGGAYVIVAHGDKDGIVWWTRSDDSVDRRWLWAGMEAPPSGVLIYLYSCYAGRALPGYLTDCDCFGHIDEVPMPAPGQEDAVGSFLDVVHALVENEVFDATKWHATLGEFVNSQLVLADNAGNISDYWSFLKLRKSLAFFDE